MYLSNKYTKWYNNIISSAKQRDLDGYVERHHIIPLSLGGNNSIDNLVTLTAREHFICHLLLTKMVEHNSKAKMIYAIWRMSNSVKERKLHKITAWRYQSIRLTRKNLKMSNESRAKSSATKLASNITAWNKGIARSEKEKELMCIRKRESSQKKRDKGLPTCWNKNRPHSIETLNKITEKARNRTKIKCIHCNKYFFPGNYAVWHGNNCKFKPQ